MTAPPEDLTDRLATIAEELADRAVVVLHDALAAQRDGDDDLRAALQAQEKRLTKARRAVEKAIHELER